MNEGNLALRYAQQHMQAYSQESDVMQLHNEAMDCRNTEDVIHMAVDAFEWTMRADQSYRFSIYSGGEENETVERQIEELFHHWMDLSAKLEPRIKRQIDRGFELEKIDEYRHCLAEMGAIVRSLKEGENQTLPDMLREHRDAAIQEFHNGETAEFF